MTMEEMWNTRAFSVKSCAQPGPSATNQFNIDPGQCSQPCMAKEVCVIEQTFRQEPMLPNFVVNFGSQGLQSQDKLRSELLAMVSESQQHVGRPSYGSSGGGRSPYAAFLYQSGQMTLPDIGTYSGWPSQSPILPPATRGDGDAKSSFGMDGQGRNFGRAQDGLPSVNGSRAPPVVELLMQSSLNFGRGAGELGMEGSWQVPSSQWSSEPARQRRQRNQSSSGPFPTSNGSSASLNTTGSGFLSQSQSVVATTSSGGLRVYCISYFGVPIVGQLGLTDFGRLGVTCTCHSQHMSVAKFTQHSGLTAANPGKLVFIEGGENLVQWRKSFFSQYGVKVPEDGLGWEWLDAGAPMEAGKYKAAVSVTRSWQKELDVSCGGSTPMMKSRITTQHMRDAMLPNGNTSTLHATESVSNANYGVLGNNDGMLDTREAMLKSYGQFQKSLTSDLGAGNQFYSAENIYSQAQINMETRNTFQGMGQVSTGSGYNTHLNPHYNSFSGQQQGSGGSRQRGKAANHPGHESRMREADISSSFELRLGQPSQQSQAAGTSFSSMATSSVEHPKSHLLDQVMSKGAYFTGWNGKLQHNLQEYNPAILPKFSGIPSQPRDQEGALQSVHGKTDFLENGVVERPGEDRGSAVDPSTFSLSTRQLSQNPGYRVDGVSVLQEKLTSLESLQSRPNMLSRSMDRQFLREQSGHGMLAANLFPHAAVGTSRSVALENNTGLDSLNSGALEQLSKKTGERLLETAIQSSFAYRAMGMEGSAAGSGLKGVVASASRAEGQFAEMDTYGRSNCVSGQRASFLEFSVGNRLGQNESGLAVASANGPNSRAEQDSNHRAFQILDLPGATFTKQQQQHSVQSLVLQECSENRGMVDLGRGLGAEQELGMRRSLTWDKDVTEWQCEEHRGSSTDRPGRGRLLGAPEVERTAHSSLKSTKVESGAMVPSRLCVVVDKEAERIDVQSQRLEDTAVRDVRGLATDAVSTQGDLEAPTMSGGDIHCSCLKCRKAIPSVRGQAVPRFAGQVCLKDRAGLASTMDAAKMALVEGEHISMGDFAHREQPDAETQLDMKARKSSSEEEEGAECNDEGVSQNEDVLSDTGANGAAAAAARGRVSTLAAGEASPDTGVCSNSSKNVSSGPSHGGCGLREKDGPDVMQGSGAAGVPGVVDEGSGIGKCCSSDGVDVGVIRQTNTLSSATLEDQCKVVRSPSSLGCPSSSNIRERLVVKKGGMRGISGGFPGVIEMEVDNEVEGIEPTSNTVKVERRQRRNTKWTWLGSSGVDDDEDAKASSPGESSFGQEAEPQVTSETARLGSKNLELGTRRDGSTRDLWKAWSGEMVPSSKRRKLLVPRRHQEAKATNMTEENFEAAARSFDDDQSEKKAGATLVIRVPQGVNRQKAKMGIPTKLPSQLRSGTPRVSRADVWEDGLLGRGELEAGMPTFSGGGLPMKDVLGFGAGRGGAAGTIHVPSIMTKSVRSPRTPLAGPSPRNGRMMSLSVILNQAASEVRSGKSEACPKTAVPTVVETFRAATQQKLRDGVTNSIPRRESKTTHKRSEAYVGSFSVATGSQSGDVKYDRGGPSHDTRVAWKALEGRTRVMQRKEDRKVRSMSELTSKDDLNEPGSLVFDFADDEAVPRATEKLQSAALQMAYSAAGPGRLGAKPCPFPRGERSARPGGPSKWKVEWHRSEDAQAETLAKSLSTGAEKVTLENGGTYVCKVSQVTSNAGSSISKEKLQEGFGGQGLSFRKQLRSSKAKRINVAIVPQVKGTSGSPAEIVEAALVNQKMRQVQVAEQGQLKVEITGNELTKRRPDMLLPGESAKRPRVFHTLKYVKEGVVAGSEGATSGEQLRSSSQRGFYSEQKKTEALVDYTLAGSGKVPTRDIFQTSDVNGRRSTLKTERGNGGVPVNRSGQGGKCKCDVCGTFSSASYNKLLRCGRCPVKVHQACYGVPKVPKRLWLCRTCKFKVTNPICVLCGYGGGAMTRVQKARQLCSALLQTWRELKNETNACASVLEDDDYETLLSATSNIQLSRAKTGGFLTGIPVKKREAKWRECESCEFAEPREEGSLCKVYSMNSAEPGSAGGDGAAVVSSSGREDWRQINTVGNIAKDPGAKQWAHMVCSLWMPGTRCLNMGTMGAFDVSGVTIARRKALCSMCQRKGGACIECRVPKCFTPFHVWCAHEKGLLQSEIVQDGTNQVSFFGTCQRHASFCASELGVESREGPDSGSREVCARTEGYKGRLTLEERAKAQQRMILEGSAAVTHEQVAAWLRIDERKLPTRRIVKSAHSSSMKCDQREYLRFKQKKGWKRLGVYKSGIHALGLYTTDFIAEGEVVVEYVGEIVGLRVADKREAEYHSGKRLQYQGACYLFRIDTEQIIDATRKGGIARFVNHSCSPNCVAKVISVENLKKVVFFAKRDIYAKEEITYDYKFNCDEVGDKIPCFCGTPECRGTLN